MLQTDGQSLNLLSQIVRLPVRRQLVPLLGEGVEFILHFDDVIRLELVKGCLSFRIQLLELFQLCPLLPAIRNNGVDDLLERIPNLRQILLRHRPAAGGAGDTGDKGFQYLIFPLILTGQRLNLGIGVGHRLGVP